MNLSRATAYHPFPRSERKKCHALDCYPLPHTLAILNLRAPSSDRLFRCRRNSNGRRVVSLSILFEEPEGVPSLLDVHARISQVSARLGEEFAPASEFFGVRFEPSLGHGEERRRIHVRASRLRYALGRVDGRRSMNRANGERCRCACSRVRRAGTRADQS